MKKENKNIELDKKSGTWYNKKIIKYSEKSELKK